MRWNNAIDAPACVLEEVKEESKERRGCISKIGRHHRDVPAGGCAFAGQTLPTDFPSQRVTKTHKKRSAKTWSESSNLKEKWLGASMIQFFI